MPSTNRRPCQYLATILVIALLWLIPTLVNAEEEWYRVQIGDTIQSIAAQFGVTAEAIMQHNGLAAASPIARGQILRVPLPQAQPATAQTEPGVGLGRTHIVQPGESLQTIGQLYGIDWSSLARANSISNPNLIYVGQAIVVPSAAMLEVLPAVAATTDPSTTSAHVNRAGSPSAQYRLHLVQYGDDFSRIAHSYGLSVADILIINDFGSVTRLYIGDLILLPPAASLAPSVRAFSPSDAGTQHIVQRGETLAVIAAQYGRTFAEIAAANSLLNPDRIDVGQVLIIP